MDLNELKEIPLLRALSDEQLEILQGNAQKRDYKKNKRIFEPDSKDNFIMIVLEGKVRIYLAYPDGKEFTISFLEQGDIYSSHSKTFAEAREATKILAINAQAFHLFMLNNPTILISMVKALGDSLGNTLRIIENLAFLDIDKRLARFLLDAAKEKGVVGQEGTFINLGLSVEDLALAVGSSRQTASMLLNRWERDGVIRRNRKTVFLLDMLKLQELGGRID
ncbi:Crp/Fnr family transcriptional regulator [Desulfosporosinus hippei]|uniref:cAMP-binding domain of CRP or a regulatory subunit of cAMP-dependent protein kinases n=1 Tax=Desulfosporosinus hippei DSM 8344 TaxID=1121419 RepID=A0A1G8FBB5_9FIRM|nr:Crp/Fnr family transcriptional regulator [Desulfosporosinus hippei]SDH79441.1 cAMP-binding domain of CRP or a regulatory subunit of cAMP-dependent protein kinases [Desulfosporosinus hippei DSM 8344]